MKHLTLELTDHQRRELEHTRDHERRAYLRERAAALLKIAHGHSPHQVAHTGLLKPRDPDTVYAWLRAYRQGGAAALIQKPRGHRGFSPRTGGTPEAGGATTAPAVWSGPQPLAPPGPGGGAALPGGLHPGRSE